MVDTPTKVADIIIPERFNPYFQEQTTRVNAFFTSGIVQTVPGLTFGDRGGTQVDMPFWDALGERAQILDDTTDLAIKKIGTKQDTAVLHARALVYGATDLSAAFAGSDPMTFIGNGVAENWSHEFNMVLISTLKGAMGALAAESPDVNFLDITGLSGPADEIDGASFIDAAQLLGDHKDRISGILMHSAVEAHLAKNDLIEFIRDSEGNIVMRTFMGKTVVVDDANSPVGDVFTTYLFGAGAIGFGEAQPKVPSAVAREELLAGGQEYLVTRRHWVLHPRGIRWTPASGGAAVTPSDAQLEAAANWTRVYDPKNIRIVAFKHRVA